MEEAPKPQVLSVVPPWVQQHCVIPDGFRRGDPLKLYDFQLKYLANFYLVRGDVTFDAKAPVLAPAFVYRRGLLVAAQKKGKAPLTAAQVCVEGVGPALFAGWAGSDDGWACSEHGCRCGWEWAYEPGEPMAMRWPTPLIQITAFSYEQTVNVYAALRPMIELGRLADIITHTGEEFIRLPGGGRIDTVTSSAQSRLGQRVTHVAQDEVGLWTEGNKMTRVADTQYRGLAGMGGRASLTTNAWDPSENSVAQQQYESPAEDIYRQFVQPPSRLSYGNKQHRHRIHQIAYEETVKERGGHIDLDAIGAEADDLLPRDPAQAERFFGNRLVAGHGTWLPAELWPAAEMPVLVPEGADVCLGFDGSESSDHTAIRAETLDGFRFTPLYGPERRPTIWDPAQWGGQIPRNEVNAAVDELARRYKLIRAYCDPRDWQSEIGDWSLRYGDKVFVEWPTYRVVAMHDALTRAVNDLVSGRSSHDACPITALHVGNARKVARSGERYILAKPNEHQKIDAAMADVLAHEAASDARAAGWGAPEPEIDNRMWALR